MSGSPASTIRFNDVTSRSGITYHWSVAKRPMRIIDAIGGGCAFVDYDCDGWLDILLVGPSRVALFHNERNGHFREVTDAAGMGNLKGVWMGCACGDVDGDGRPDILLTGYRRLALLRNEPGGKFTDVTIAMGLDPGNRMHWGLSAGFMDLDGGGWPSLVLTNYVDYGPAAEQYCEIRPGIRSGCPPNHYRPEYAEIWRNFGGKRFKDVSRECGIWPLHGNSMTVAFADTGASGRVDFYIGNDGKPAELIRNLGQMRFRNVGRESGAAYNNMGHAIAAMGADWGDYDRDGRPDLAITAFSDEPFSLLHNAGHGILEYASDQTGIMGATYTSLGFGAKWLDMDNDGWMDIAFSNGHVYDNADLLYPGTSFRQPIMLFHNVDGSGGRHFVDECPHQETDVNRSLLGRGLAAGDYDNDGRVDLLVVDYEGSPLLLHNISTSGNHWITIELRGEGHNRLAYGAKVEARSSNLSGMWSSMVSPAGSFLSSSDSRVHFGLGRTAVLDELRIRWPNGRVQEMKNVKADRFVRIQEPPPDHRLP
jgi:hypothetical protein